MFLSMLGIHNVKSAVIPNVVHEWYPWRRPCTGRNIAEITLQKRKA